MLEQVLTHLHNWFVQSAHNGTFTVQDGSLALPFLLNGQYFRIIGSTFNDGLHQYPASGLTDETFTGAVWALAVPTAVLAMSQDIAEWNAKNGAPSPFASESFGGYSYTRATDAKGGALSWQSAFADRLKPYRKSPLVREFAQAAHQGAPPWR